VDFDMHGRKEGKPLVELFFRGKKGKKGKPKKKKKTEKVTYT